jgi:TM2 domain-containing membrane protein YozV
MDCVNHSGVAATAYCQNCGKALCAHCVRTTAGGQILCEPCWTAWQSAQAPFAGPFAGPYAPHGQPNPAVAAALGVIPGVGAMYNGQFVKGLIHIFIFAVLASTASHFDVFGFLVAGWIFYQVFEAYHVAKARRDGLPIPDPLGLNEIGNWLNIGPRGPMPPGAAGAGGAGFGPGPTANPGGTNPGGTSPGVANPGGTGAPTSGQAQGWQAPYQGPYGGPYGSSGQGAGYPGQYTGQYTGQGFPPVPPIPPIPPVPPLQWRRKEPIGAVILIALGLLFLMGRFDLFSGHAFAYAWPLILIGLGVWMVVRRMQDSQGGPK